MTNKRIKVVGGELTLDGLVVLRGKHLRKRTTAFKMGDTLIVHKDIYKALERGVLRKIKKITQLEADYGFRLIQNEPFKFNEKENMFEATFEVRYLGFWDMAKW